MMYVRLLGRSRLLELVPQLVDLGAALANCVLAPPVLDASPKKSNLVSVRAGN